jgi:hypothetical protein
VKLIAAFLFVALLAGGYAVRQKDGREMTLDACVSDASEGFQAGLPAEYAGQIAIGKIQESMTPLCGELLKRPDVESAPDEDMPRLISETFRAHPETFRPLCNAVVDADFALLGELARYVRKNERASFRRELCRLGVDYIDERSQVDHGRLVTDHPDLFAPMCGAGIHAGLADDPVFRKRLTPKQMRSIGRRACKRALVTGVFDVSGPGGFQQPRIDQRAFEELVFRAVVAETRK